MGGGGWEAEGRLYYPLEQEQGCCVFNEAQKLPQCTCQAKTVVGQQFDTMCSLISAPHIL